MREMQEADFNFNPRSPHGERRGKARRDHRGGNFNPRSPHGERRASVRVTSVPMISIHAPRTGSDCESGAVYCPEHIFQSTLPARGATDLYPRRRHDRRYFNPRSPHGERRRLHHGRRWHDHISIHAPRTGSDTGGDPFFYDSWDISIHAPRTGSDVCFFQDTPLRRLISIHAPRTGSDCAKRQSRHAFGISIHAPRTGSDHLPLLASPAGDISIHAPRTGSDPSPSGRLSRRMSISIHAPRTGSDLVACYTDIERELFQSTLPARGATYQRPSSLRTSGYFNPRSPHGERRTSGRHPCGHPAISIHAPRTGSDERPQPADAHGSHFNPRSPHGERRTLHHRLFRYANFNPRSPHGERRLARPRRLRPMGNFNPRSPHGERPAVRPVRCRA